MERGEVRKFIVTTKSPDISDAWEQLAPACTRREDIVEVVQNPRTAASTLRRDQESYFQSGYQPSDIAVITDHKTLFRLAKKRGAQALFVELNPFARQPHFIEQHELLDPMKSVPEVLDQFVVSESH